MSLPQPTPAMSTHDLVDDPSQSGNPRRTCTRCKRSALTAGGGFWYGSAAQFTCPFPQKDSSS